MRKGIVGRVAGATLLIWACSGAQAADTCGPDRYFAPEDADHRRPLRTPHAEFSDTLARANAGNAVQQRNMGVYYEAGYLVSKCLDRAAAWYAKAAATGDQKASAWMSRHAGFQQLRQGPACGGSGCAPVPGMATVIELLADSRGHFTVPVTINSTTVNSIVDTGASVVSLSSSLARQMGISYERGQPATIHTANGTKRGYVVTLGSVRVGGIALENVTGVVSDGESPVLLGMSFLGRVKMSVDGGRMTLSKP